MVANMPSGLSLTPHHETLSSTQWSWKGVGTGLKYSRIPVEKLTPFKIGPVYFSLKNGAF
jgi:hypothetical protein